VSEQILNGTSAQIGYRVPFTSVYVGKYGKKTNPKQRLLKLSTTQKKQTTGHFTPSIQSGNGTSMLYSSWG